MTLSRWTDSCNTACITVCLVHRRQKISTRHWSNVMCGSHVIKMESMIWLRSRGQCLAGHSRHSCQLSQPTSAVPAAPQAILPVPHAAWQPTAGPPPPSPAGRRDRNRQGSSNQGIPLANPTPLHHCSTANKPPPHSAFSTAEPQAAPAALPALCWGPSLAAATASLKSTNGQSQLVQGP